MSTRAWAAGLLIVTLAGCGQKDVSEDEARRWGVCAADTASVQEVFEAGRDPNTAQALSCRTAGWLNQLHWKWFLSAEHKAVVAHAANEQLARTETYRRGLYAAMLGAGPGQPAEFGDIGVFLESVALTRARSLQCGIAGPAELAHVGAIDTFFTVAAIGLYARVGEPQRSQELASQLLEAAVSRAELRAQENFECEAALAQRFREDVQQWLDFAQGTHPWVPGCRVQEEGEDLVLQCAPRS